MLNKPAISDGSWRESHKSAVSSAYAPGQKRRQGHRSARITALLSEPARYGESAEFIGTLKTANGEPVASRELRFEESRDGKSWPPYYDSWALTSNDGEFLVRSPNALLTTRYFRMRFAGDTELPPAISPVFVVKPTAGLSAPAVPATAEVNSSFASSCFLRPHHKEHTYPVVIRCYRRERQPSGVYEFVYKKSVRAKAHDLSGGSTCRAAISLGSRGWWRLRVYHAEDSRNAKTFSGYGYIRVQ